jgi:large subunit ribosomal protein L25
MSNETISLNAVTRDVAGEKVKALRAQGKVPAVVHNHGKDSIHILVEEIDLKKVFANAGKHHPVTVNVDGKNFTTLIKEVTYKPATAIVYHAVLQAIKANETAKAEVPLKLVGEIPAEKKSLLIINNIEVVEIEALPKDLIDTLEVDATTLENDGDKILISDITVPKGVTILSDPETVIAAVETPRDQIAAADAALAEDAAAAGEVEISNEEATEDESKA